MKISETLCLFAPCTISRQVQHLNAFISLCCVFILPSHCCIIIRSLQLFTSKQFPIQVVRFVYSDFHRIVIVYTFATNFVAGSICYYENVSASSELTLVNSTSACAVPLFMHAAKYKNMAFERNLHCSESQNH